MILDNKNTNLKVHEWIAKYTKEGKLSLVTGYFTIGALAYLSDKIKDIYINDGSIDDPRERKANEFAAEILIPRDRNPEIASLRAKADVILLADELKISPGIVAGRFQRLTEKWNYFNGLKRKFQWTA